MIMLSAAHCTKKSKKLEFDPSGWYDDDRLLKNNTHTKHFNILIFHLLIFVIESTYFFAVLNKISQCYNM